MANKMTHENVRCDRLSALIDRFQISVTPMSGPCANLLILEDLLTAAPRRVLLSPHGPVNPRSVEDETVTLSAMVAWGGAANPLFASLPAEIDIDLTSDAETTTLISLFRAEAWAQRCGVETVLDRLGEILIIRLLRVQISRGTTEPGLLAGLAEPRIARAIVAIHEGPGRSWRSEDLAEIAGLSLSRFAELFAASVGETPMAYLRRWRMVLARQDLARGERVQTVARRYGYGSGEALSRAFRRSFGTSPIALRRKAAA